MNLLSTAAPLAALVTLASCHAVILNAQGDPGSPATHGFQMTAALARNCTSINPCQQDATLIRDAEIAANVVNECGRTELQGNIDIGENTENMLAANQVTHVQRGSTVTITMHQVNADGAGPFVCDMDPTSNGLALTGQIPLEVTSDNIPGSNGLSQAKEQDFNLTVKMPADMQCIGASTGNVCTVRCRNNAQAGPFGGCFPVQQTDIAPNQNTAHNVKAFKSLEDVNAQIAKNQANLPAAAKAIAAAGSDGASQALAAANALVGGLPNQNPQLATQPPRPDPAQLNQAAPITAGAAGGQGIQPGQGQGQGQPQPQAQGGGQEPQPGTLGGGQGSQPQTQDGGQVQQGQTQGDDDGQTQGGQPTVETRRLRGRFERLQVLV